MKTNKIFSLSAFTLLPLLCFAQFESAEIGVDGLTCSMCTRSTEMNIRKLDFVDSVAMDLTNTNGKIFFKKGVQVSIEKIAKAVTDAGFSVRHLNANMNFNDVAVSENFCWDYENEQYQFVKTADKKLSDLVTLKFIGAKYLSKKEFKKWSSVIAGAKGKGCIAKSIYYITL